MTLLSCWDVLRFSARFEVELFTLPLSDLHGIAMADGKMCLGLVDAQTQGIIRNGSPNDCDGNSWGVFMRHLGLQDCWVTLRTVESFRSLFFCFIFSSDFFCSG